LALASAGRNIEARIAMLAITTSNSMSVNAPDKQLLEADPRWFLLVLNDA